MTCCFITRMLIYNTYRHIYSDIYSDIYNYIYNDIYNIYSDKL